MESCRLKMLIVVISLSILGLIEGNVLHVKHAPSYMVFGDGSKINLASSNLPSELASALGVKSQKTTGAIKSKSVLKRPAANVLLTLMTSKGHDFAMDSLASFPLDWDVPFVDVSQLMTRVQRKFLTEDPLMLNLLSDDELFDVDTRNSIFKSLPSSLSFAKERFTDPDSITSAYLNSSHDADSRLLAELQTVQGAVSTLKSNPDSIRTKTPDLLSFTLTGLKAIGDAHGVESEQTKEAEKLVTKTVDKLTEDLKDIYGGNVMVEVIITPATEHGNVRHTRSLKADEKEAVKLKDLNLALEWDENFPVTFNIILWLMVILIIFLIFISYGIWNMNPNLESILYRVPQDESKKTN